MAGRASDFDDLPLRFDFVNGVEFALATSGADDAGMGPSCRRFEIRVPEGPGTALSRSRGVDLAATGLVVKEDAITVAKLFQAFPNTDSSDMVLLKLLDIHLANFSGHRSDFFLIDPDVAWCSRAAVAALATCELESFEVPGRF